MDVKILPYKNKEDLPEQVKGNSPEDAPEIYLKLLKMHGNNIRALKNVGEMSQGNKYPIKLHGLLLNRKLEHETYKKRSFLWHQNL